MEFVAGDCGGSIIVEMSRGGRGKSCKTGKSMIREKT